MTQLTPTRKIKRTDAKRRRSIVEEKRQRMSEGHTMSTNNMLTNVPTAPPTQPMSEEELRRSFDEWMKIVADNKINSTNSWKLELIDYFHDLTVLRDGDSINFQKASCTLDGCVKIYTSRVDSVDTETKQLLIGLIDHNKNKDGEEEENMEENQVKTSRKREHRPGNTLEKDISNLNLKKLDMDFVVDPLFRKTSADFDEGGARGLLLNHLGISSRGRIIFDAGDVAMDENDEEILFENDDDAMMDLEKLKARFQSDLSNLYGMEICWPLKDFLFSDEHQAFDADFDFKEDENMEELYDFNNPYEPGSDEVDCDYDFGPNDHGEEDDNQHGRSWQVDTHGSTNPHDALFSFFDSNMNRNWAGPEHWRSRPLREREDKPKARKPKVPKERERIDFISSEPIDVNILFAKSNASTTLPKNDKNRSNHLLPDDMHFSSKDLLKLFSNPEFPIKFRSKGGRASYVNNLSITQDIQGPVEGQFWAEHERIPDEDIPTAQPVDDGLEYDDPFGVEDEHDDYEDVPPSNMNDASLLDLLDYGDQLVEQPKKVQSAPLKYAKTAKRVDVKKLKDNVWIELVNDCMPTNDEQLPEISESNKLNGEKKFTEIVKGLDHFYSENKRKDISVAFCFICVLHLANEQNLAIKGTDQLQELYITQNSA